MKSFFIAAGAASLLSMSGAAQIPAHSSLRQEAYVWQRAWSPAVYEAVAIHGSAFSNLLVLAAEVSWKKQEPDIIRVKIDYKTLLAARARAGLVLRIGPYHGSFSDEDAPISALISLALSLLAEAKANGAAPSELQLDFDCADSKLDGYRVWVSAIRAALPGIPITITALPSWLNRPAFRQLIANTDGYVLQVHSLDRPKSFDSIFTLCDPVAAKKAVELAGSFGVPFRVALPTYGYLLAFAPDGRFVGLSAEGRSKSWPPNAKLREVSADPVEMGRLVQAWSREHAPAMQGIIWYRLPTAADHFNWRWPTLAAILELHSPQEHLRTELRRVEAGLYEISLVNDGELDLSSRLAFVIHWPGARLVAGDGVNGFELVEVNASTGRVQSMLQRLRAGDRKKIGWLRLDKDVEVQIEIQKP